MDFSFKNVYLRCYALVMSSKLLELKTRDQ